MIATAPYRIDLAGAWSDTSPLDELYGGAVANAAVEIDDVPRLKAQTYTDPKGEPEGMEKAVLQVAEAPAGVRIRFRSPFDAGTGLGISSILAACGVAACWDSRRNWTTQELADAVTQVEIAMGTNGGWQDQWGAILPGVKYLTNRGRDQQVFLGASAAAMVGNLVLIDTGKRRPASSILLRVVEQYRAMTPDQARKAMYGLRWAARVAREAIMENQAGTLGWAMEQTSIAARALGAPGLPEAPWLNAVSYGWKWCGAGGGGFMVALAKDPSVVMEAAKAEGMTPYRVRLATKGLSV